MTQIPFVIGIGIILLIPMIGIYLIYQAKKIQDQKKSQVQKTQRQLKQASQTLDILKNKIALYQERIAKDKQQIKGFHQQQEILDKQIENKKNLVNSYYESLKSDSSKAYENYVQTLEQSYKKKEKDFQKQVKDIDARRKSFNAALDQIRSSLEAATAARLRQQEEQNKLFFYKIQLSDHQATDITHLQEWKSRLYDPTLVSKIIWSSYIMKPTTDMCNRVLGTTSPVCGIYKITNKSTGEIYIGQSVNVADRWKQHVKCGLGIDASPTNRLYNNMQNTGVWNFTFELLQKCSRDKLNEKERFWIDMYQSNKVGLNSTKGNKS